MLLSDFSFDLPERCIAQYPLADRDASRMLVVDRKAGRYSDAQFRTLPGALRGDELIVVNDARVIPARLLGRRQGIRAEPPGKHSRTGREFLTSEIEVLLLRQVAPDQWEALVRPGKKVRVGERVIFGQDELVATVLYHGDAGMRRVRLEAAGDLRQAIERLGHVPLPPYIHRADQSLDRERYQTIFASKPSAAAAPTAGLHFSEAILEQLRRRGIEWTAITLEVGLGTFQPIHTEHLEDHKIHAERYEISDQAARAISRARSEQRPILAVGTTVVRALEDAAEKAEKSAKAPGGAVLVEPGAATAEIFIRPGHRFRAVDQLITNFHLPQSTLLVLVSAFAGRELVLASYRHAVAAGYRFYSYGDCMWIL